MSTTKSGLNGLNRTTTTKLAVYLKLTIVLAMTPIMPIFRPSQTNIVVIHDGKPIMASVEFVQRYQKEVSDSVFFFEILTYIQS